MTHRVTDKMFLLHCSGVAHPEGRVLEPCSRHHCDSQEYQGHDYWNRPYEQILAMFRPPELAERTDAVYMIDNNKDIGLCGGNMDHVFIVIPEPPATRHDLNWINEIHRLLYYADMPTCKEDADPRFVHAARSYWAGLPHPDKSIWEYLALSAEVVCEIAEGKDVDQVLSGYNEKSDVDFPDVPDWSP